MVKKEGWYKNPTFIFSLVAGISILGAGIVKLAVYITLPDRVAAEEEKVKSVEDYIKEQQLANHLMEKLVQEKDKKEEIVLSPDKKSYWNEDKKEWLPIKK